MLSIPQIYTQHAQVIDYILSMDNPQCTYFFEHGLHVKIPFMFNKRICYYILETQSNSTEANARVSTSSGKDTRILCKYKKQLNKWIFEFEDTFEDMVCKLKIIVDASKDIIRFEYELTKKKGKSTARNTVFGTIPAREVQPELIPDAQS